MVELILFSLFLEVGMDKELVFYSILDFFPRKDKIKAIYKSLSLYDKKLYKHYVYSICFEREYTKDLIWEYLNDWEESYDRFKQEYFIKRRKQIDACIKDSVNCNNDSNDSN